MSFQDETSSENTKTASTDDLKKIGRLNPGASPTASSNISILERDLSAEKEGRKEERFVWALVCTVLFNVIIAQQIGWHLIWLLVFEFLFLFVFGRICGVDFIYEETQKAIDTVAKMRALRNEDRTTKKLKASTIENESLPELINS